MEPAGVKEEPERPDEISDEEGLPVSNNRNLSRQELKQLDREIPWKEVAALPRATCEKYLDAARVEHANWMRWGGI